MYKQRCIYNILYLMYLCKSFGSKSLNLHLRALQNLIRVDNLISWLSVIPFSMCCIVCSLTPLNKASSRLLNPLLSLISFKLIISPSPLLSLIRNYLISHQTFVVLIFLFRLDQPCHYSWAFS